MAPSGSRQWPIPRALPGVPLVQQLLLARVRNEPIALGFLARELARAADRLGLFPVLALRWLFIGAPLPHFTKYAFTLHFLFQNTESLIDIVVADKNLQWIFLPVGRVDATNSQLRGHARGSCPIVAAPSTKPLVSD